MNRQRLQSGAIAALCASAALLCGSARADGGKLLLTGGVSSIDGAAGGGLTPWADFKVKWRFVEIGRAHV